MAITRLWNESKPAGTDAANTLDTQGQEHKQDTRERMVQGGHVWNQSTLTDEGKHALGLEGAGSGPHIYKADKVTKILDWTSDTLATLLASYQITGSKNFDRLTPRDDMVGIDAFTTAKGYKHAKEAFRIFETATPDALVNVKSGVYLKAGGAEAGYFAGGNINISGAKAGLAASQQRFSTLVLRAGVLTWINGTLIADPGPPTDIADAVLDDIVLGQFKVFDNSTNFVRDGSDPDTFLVLDGRVDAHRVGPSSGERLVALWTKERSVNIGPAYSDIHSISIGTPWKFRVDFLGFGNYQVTLVGRTDNPPASFRIVDADNVANVLHEETGFGSTAERRVSAVTALPSWAIGVKDLKLQWLDGGGIGSDFTDFNYADVRLK